MSFAQSEITRRTIPDFPAVGQSHFQSQNNSQLCVLDARVDFMSQNKTSCLLKMYTTFVINDKLVVSSGLDRVVTRIPVCWCEMIVLAERVVI